MMRLLLFASVVLMLGLGPAPGAPVTIISCRGGITSIELTEIASYDVALHNGSTKSVDEVKLSARYGRHEKRAAFDVKLALAPGADLNQHVRHNVAGGLFSNWSDQNDCTVDYVHFTDGTSWSPPSR
jgi:hypothetical protein